MVATFIPPITLMVLLVRYLVYLLTVREKPAPPSKLRLVPLSRTYTLATILKTRSTYNNAGTPQITDDKLTYDLSVRVESNDPTGQGITPAPLVGTNINVDGAGGTYILVSDAIPAGTDLAVAPTPPPGWQAVYTTDADYD